MMADNPHRALYDRRQLRQPFSGEERRKEKRRQFLRTVPDERRRVEKRYFMRKPLRVRVTLMNGGSNVEALSTEIGPGGMGVLLKSTPDLIGNYGVKIFLNDRISFDLSGRILHARKLDHGVQYQAGFQFKTGFGWERQLLSTVVDSLPHYASPAPNLISSEHGKALRNRKDLPEIPEGFNRRLKIQRFMLLINGEKVDTGGYEYFPYAEKLISDRNTTLKMMGQLRAGNLPAGYEDYVSAQYCIGTNRSNQLAMEAACQASQEYRHWPLKKRRKILDDVHAGLLARKEKLVGLLVAEGHPEMLAEWEFEGVEASLRKKSLDMYFSHLNEPLKGKGSEKMILKRRPDGVVGVIPPKNASASSSLVALSSLLAGNALIIKPPLRSPIATMFLWNEIVHQVLEANGAPKGVLNVITGNSRKVMEEWMKSSLVNDILFFGDSETGIELGVEIYRHGKKPILELSGNDQMFVWKDAPLASSVSALMDGFLGSTQICMVPKKALIHEGIFNDFRDHFVAETLKLKVGLPTQKEVVLSPVLKIPQFYQSLNDALEKGAKLLCGGERVNHQGTPDKDGIFITPAVLEIDDVEKAMTMQCFIDENFFPLIPLVKVTAGSATGLNKDKEIFKKMVSISDQHRYGLRISAWTSSKQMIRKFADCFHNSGLLRINSRHAGFSEGLSSQGGTKLSGGPFGELNYVWQKTTHLQGISISKPPEF